MEDIYLSCHSFTKSKKACNGLSPIVWVHNLSYEFQFIREYLEDIAPISVFARSERKPINSIGIYSNLDVLTCLPANHLLHGVMNWDVKNGWRLRL